MDSPARKPRASLADMSPFSPASSRHPQDQNRASMQVTSDRAAGASGDAADIDIDSTTADGPDPRPADRWAMLPHPGCRAAVAVAEGPLRVSMLPLQPLS
eukprot:2044873-Alexandrium_andersonii.AAC.1